MKFYRTTLNTCHEADGIVIVVDVLRAFTTAAYAFDQGAEEIFLVSTVEEAFALRERYPDCLLMGEADGLPIEGFDLPNSPSAIEILDLNSQKLIHRTTAGTQGAVRAIKAGRLFAASLCVASATARHIKALHPQSVTFVETGVRADDEGGEEDIACADYIESLLQDTPSNKGDIEDRVRRSGWAARFTDPAQADFPEADLKHALKFDRFDFAMEVERRGALLVLKTVH